MNVNDAREVSQFNALWTLGMENYGRKVTPQLLQMNMRLLANFSVDEVRQAVMLLMSTKEYPFTVADVVKAIGRLGGRQVDADDILQDNAVRFWNAFVSHVRSNSALVSPDTRGIAALIYVFNDIKGYFASPKSEETWKRKEFIEMYKKDVEGYPPAHVIDAPYNNFVSGIKHITCIGEVKTCLKYAKIYFNTERIAVDYPETAVPLAPPISQPCTEEEKLANLNKLQELLMSGQVFGEVK